MENKEELKKIVSKCVEEIKAVLDKYNCHMEAGDPWYPCCCVYNSTEEWIAEDV